jgi:hypothetical protein
LYKSNNKFSKSIKVHKQSPKILKPTKSEAIRKESSPEDEKQETIYRFYSFKDRDFTFKYIRRLWANSSPFAGSDDEESENSDEEVKEAES